MSLVSTPGGTWLRRTRYTSSSRAMSARSFCRLLGRRVSSVTAQILPWSRSSRLATGSNMPNRRALHKDRVARVRLHLRPQVRAGRRDVQAVEEALHFEVLAQQRLDVGQLLRRDHEMQVEAHDRLGIGIDRLAADHAVADAVRLQQADQPLKQVRPVAHDGFPECQGFHQAALIAMLSRKAQPPAIYHAS